MSRGTRLQDGDAHRKDHARWSRRDFLMHLAGHLAYHLGQIGLLRRMNGLEGFA